MIRHLTDLAVVWWQRAGVIRSHWPAIVAVPVSLFAIFWIGRDAADRALLATMLFSQLTAIFAFLAYHFTKEKFRLDLFEKRYLLYEAVVTFCSEITAHGSLTSQNQKEREDVERAIKAAHESFRGIGYHKARALFGEDIHQLFDKLNKSYSWLSTYGAGPAEVPQHAWAKRKHDETLFIWDTVKRLPELFRNYMYFGDYKRDWV